MDGFAGKHRAQVIMEKLGQCDGIIKTCISICPDPRLQTELEKLQEDIVNVATKAEMLSNGDEQIQSSIQGQERGIQAIMDEYGCTREEALEIMNEDITSGCHRKAKKKEKKTIKSSIDDIVMKYSSWSGNDDDSVCKNCARELSNAGFSKEQVQEYFSNDGIYDEETGEGTWDKGYVDNVLKYLTSSCQIKSAKSEDEFDEAVAAIADFFRVNPNGNVVRVDKEITDVDYENGLDDICRKYNVSLRRSKLNDRNYMVINNSRQIKSSTQSSGNEYDYSFFYNNLKDNPSFEEHHVRFDDDQGEDNIHTKGNDVALKLTRPDGKVYTQPSGNYIQFWGGGWRFNVGNNYGYKLKYSEIENASVTDNKIVIDINDGTHVEFGLDGAILSSRKPVKSSFTCDTCGGTFDESELGFEDNDIEGNHVHICKHCEEGARSGEDFLGEHEIDFDGTIESSISRNHKNIQALYG